MPKNLPGHGTNSTLYGVCGCLNKYNRSILLGLWDRYLRTYRNSTYERAVRNAFHSMMVVEFSWRSFEVNWDLFIGSWNMGDGLFRGRKWACMILKIINHSNWGKCAQENVMFYPPKRPLTHQIHLTMWVKCLCDPLDGNNSMVEHLHQFLCQNVQTAIG